MAARLTRLFARYALRHLSLSQPGPALHDAAGAEIGRVERILLNDQRLVVEGRAPGAERLVLELAGHQRLGVPGPGGRFRLELPFAPGHPLLSLTRAGGSDSLVLPVFGAGRLARARVRLWPRFLWQGVRALPAAWGWLRHGDPAARMRVKMLLGLGPASGELTLDAAQFPAAVPGAPEGAEAAPVPPPGPAAGLVIVLPVYQAFDLLPEVLDRIRRNTDLPWRLVVVEDASPDPAIRPFLRDWAAGQAQVTLIENETNLGFVLSANRGLALASGMGLPVVLLNADAFLPAGWASRLLAPLLADPAVASVTPMSNDAELMSVPAICARTVLAPGAGDAIDRAARRLAPPEGGLPVLPTAVGFCMAISPAFLARLPHFDPAFGRGYGEEVDWCQKIRALGGRHLCQTGLFVEHRGGSSFGSAAKQALLRENGARISSRHPGFDAEVQGFIGADPLITARLALGLAWAGTLAGEVPVYLGHALGGGAEHHLQDVITRDLVTTGAAVVLRVGGPARFEIVLHSPAGVTRAATADRGLVLRLLRLLPRRAVIYSCGVGDPDPVTLPRLLLDLARGGHRLEVMIHDYLPLSPSYSLLDADGVFRGPPLPGRSPRGHDSRRANGRPVGLARWQTAWGALMAEAHRVVAFSQASRDLVDAVYPGLGPRLELRRHDLLHAVPRLAAPRRGARPVIGVLGNIGPHKGAGVLQALSQRLARGRAADLVVLGQIDPAFHLTPPARLHGGYEVMEIPDLAARHGITCWLIPSVWPETFSYATHEALATGLPVICFDLGAQAEAVREAMARGAPGAILPLPGAPPDLDALIGAVRDLWQAAE